MAVILRGDVRELGPDAFPEPFGVVLADPPWLYNVTIGEGGVEYDVLDDAGLCALPVASWAAPNAILLLWATWPKLDVAMRLVEAWGFQHVTGFPWVKITNLRGIQYGTGYWVRGCSEPILIARRGNVSPPRDRGFLGLLSPNISHSRKPEDIYAYAEALPGPYLELFARRPRHGWTSVGNEVAGPEAMEMSL